MKGVTERKIKLMSENYATQQGKRKLLRFLERIDLGLTGEMEE